MELGLSTNGLISPLPKALGLNCPKPVFRPQTPNGRALGSEHFFMSSSIQFLHQINSHFQILEITFDKVTSVCLLPENCKKILQKSSFWCHFWYYSSVSLVWKNTIFWSTKIQISLELLEQVLKMSPFWNPLIKGLSNDVKIK